MFLNLRNLVVLHHSSAGVGEGDLLFLAATKTTAGQNQIKILSGLKKLLISLNYTFFPLIVLLLLYSKPNICSSLTTPRLFGLGDLPSSVLECSSDRYLLEDMRPGHVSFNINLALICSITALAWKITDFFFWRERWRVSKLLLSKK